MAASLSSPHPANPRKQELNRARLNPVVNNLIMSMTLLKNGHDGGGRKWKTKRYLVKILVSQTM